MCRFRGCSSRVRDFSTRVLAPIVDHDHEHAHKLLPTLQALSENGWNMTKTSEALFLNRRSLYPRLERLERLLNCELSDIEARLAIDLALRTREA
jgi:purine catabolism regulator